MCARSGLNFRWNGRAASAVPLASTVLARRSPKRYADRDWWPTPMTEYQTYDIWIKALGALVVLIGVLVELVKYFDTKRKKFNVRQEKYQTRFSTPACSI